MSVIEDQPLEIKDSVLQSFSKIIDKTKPLTTLEEKLAIGKHMALTLVAFASIGLIIGFLISLLF